MPYPWAVKVRPGYDTTDFGHYRHSYVKSVAKLPSNFGGGYADGTAIGVKGVSTCRHDGDLYSSDYTGTVYLHKKGGGLPGLVSGWKELTHISYPGHSNGYGGLTEVTSLLVSQRIGRYAYAIMQEGESGNVTKELHIVRMTGPDEADKDYFTPPAQERYYWGEPHGLFWKLDTWGYGNSGFVTDHDRAPMMWLQSGFRTMAWIDTAEGRANFGWWYKSTSDPPVNQGNGWAFEQSHSSQGGFACRLMPPQNRYSAPELWWFVQKNVRSVPTGLGYSGFTFFDIDVYRARWKAGQWEPAPDMVYADTVAEAALLDDGPAPGSLAHVQRINPNRMGFETDWHNDAHKVGTIPAVMSGYSYTSVHIRTVHVDRAPDGTPIVMGNNMYPRFPSGGTGVTGAAWRLDEKGEFRLLGTVPASPALNNQDDGGLYAEGCSTTQAIWLNDRPVWLAKDHLTTMGTLTGVGVAEGRGKIWKRGELNRESWLD